MGCGSAQPNPTTVSPLHVMHTRTDEGWLLAPKGSVQVLSLRYTVAYEGSQKRLAVLQEPDRGTVATLIWRAAGIAFLISST